MVMIKETLIEITVTVLILSVLSIFIVNNLLKSDKYD